MKIKKILLFLVIISNFKNIYSDINIYSNDGANLYGSIQTPIGIVD